MTCPFGTGLSINCPLSVRREGLGCCWYVPSWISVPLFSPAHFLVEVRRVSSMAEDGSMWADKQGIRARCCLLALFLYSERRGEGKVWSFWVEDGGGAGKYLQLTGAFHICICQIYPLDRRTACAAPPPALAQLYPSSHADILYYYIGRCRGNWQIPSAQGRSYARRHQHMSPPRCVPCLAAPISTCIDDLSSTLPSKPAPLPVM